MKRLAVFFVILALMDVLLGCDQISRNDMLIMADCSQNTKMTINELISIGGDEVVRLDDVEYISFFRWSDDTWTVKVRFDDDSEIEMRDASINSALKRIFTINKARHSEVEP